MIIKSHKAKILPLLFCITSILFKTDCIGQIWKIQQASISVFNNATALPFTGKLGVIHFPIHPGLSGGLIHYYNQNEKHHLTQTYKLGLFHHGQVQTGIQLYTDFGYKYQYKNRIGLGVKAGAGYLHSFTDTEVFILKENGEYKKKTNTGRMQAMAATSLLIDYRINIKNRNPVIFFTEYQWWFQFPFVNSYVPVLPNISLHTGITFSIHKKNRS